MKNIKHKTSIFDKFKNFLNKNSDYFYFVFRLLAGLFFLLHGIQKLPGVSPFPIPVFSLLWFAGVIELATGTLFIVGLFVRYAALIAAVEMLVAFFKVHVAGSGTLNPLKNQGELALLFFIIFLILLTQGARKWSLDNLFFKN